jgi:YHS domain-containing protein
MLRIILLLILLLIVARMFWSVVDNVIEGATGKKRRPLPDIKLRRDPVCGTLVSPGTALSLQKGGATRYFCSEKCRNEYIAR